MTPDQVNALLLSMFGAAVKAADPRDVLDAHLPERPSGRVIVLGAGKASATMALALEAAWPDAPMSGAVVVPSGHAAPTKRIEVMEAAHPVPDAAGFRAAERMMTLAQSAQTGDLVLALISGGGSALLPCPAAPLGFKDEVLVNRLLLKSGLAIDDMNRVRRRISAIKGGGLARAAAPARLVTLAISDVPGDRAAAIASGPTVPDPSAHEDLSHLIAPLGPALPASVARMLASPAAEPDVFPHDFRLIATPQKSLVAAAKVAQKAGIQPVLLGDSLEGEARDLAQTMSGIATAAQTHGTPAPTPTVLISGGETTVTLGDQKPGRGGRNTEFLLSLAIHLDRAPGIYAIAADTDGIDGSDDAAGALIGPDTLAQLAKAGIDARKMLDAHDSYSAFLAIDALVTTGPTMTNVNDFRAVLICP